jgi:lipopolysaccharide biosynthesis glycosyltransferase
MQAKRIRTMKDNHRGTLKAKKIHYSGWSTPNGSRTRAACLEGKHDNRFTIGVTLHHSEQHHKQALKSRRIELTNEPGNGIMRKNTGVVWL